MSTLPFDALVIELHAWPCTMTQESFFGLKTCFPLLLSLIFEFGVPDRGTAPTLNVTPWVGDATACALAVSVMKPIESIASIVLRTTVSRNRFFATVLPP